MLPLKKRFSCKRFFILLFVFIIVIIIIVAVVIIIIFGGCLCGYSHIVLTCPIKQYLVCVY